MPKTYTQTYPSSYKNLPGSGLSTRQRKQLARDMYRMGESIKRIAWHFAVSYERAQEVVSTRMYTHQTGLDGKGLSTERRRKLAKVMHRAGETIRKIAWHFQVSYERAQEVVSAC